MKVSEHYSLGRTQASLEFVDVDISGDTKVFVDPNALRHIDSDWSRECISLLQSFFSTVLNTLRRGDVKAVVDLMSLLGEPNETHLGHSKGLAQGRGLGPSLARKIVDSLLKSKAVKSGLLEDLEDSALFVDGIGPDIISDITTNVIRSQLVGFTQDAANFYRIPLNPDCFEFPAWNRHSRTWDLALADMPITPYGPLMLVPRSVARRTQSFDYGEYADKYIIPQMQDDEINRPESALVETLRDGSRRVTKQSIVHRYGRNKSINLRVTEEHPELLAGYRRDRRASNPVLSHEELAEVTRSPLPEWEGLLAEVLGMEPGQNDATNYHHAIEILLTALFYPALDQPVRESQIHKGRKRVDIRYTNVASRGYFDWVSRVFDAPAPYVWVECKNYMAEPSNPEVDQLAGRFSMTRGRLGLLLHRGFGDRSRLIDRCRDTAQDGRGFILPLDDSDLRLLVDERINEPDSISFKRLSEIHSEIVN